MVVLIPPPLGVIPASNFTTLLLSLITGSNNALPLPPSISIDKTLSISNDWASMSTSSIEPWTTACTNAVVPIPVEISIFGGFITSYSIPPPKISNESKGP